MRSNKLQRIIEQVFHTEALRIVEVFRGVGLELEGLPQVIRVLGYKRRGTYVRPHVRRTGRTFSLETMVSFPDTRWIQYVKGHIRRHDHVWEVKLPPNVYVWVQPYVRFLFRYPIYTILKMMNLTKTEIIKAALRIRDTILQCVTI